MPNRRPTNFFKYCSRLAAFMAPVAIIAGIPLIKKGIHYPGFYIAFVLLGLSWGFFVMDRLNRIACATEQLNESRTNDAP